MEFGFDLKLFLLLQWIWAQLRRLHRRERRPVDDSSRKDVRVRTSDDQRQKRPERTGQNHGTDTRSRRLGRRIGNEKAVRASDWVLEEEQFIVATSSAEKFYQFFEEFDNDVDVETDTDAVNVETSE